MDLIPKYTQFFIQLQEVGLQTLWIGLMTLNEEPIYISLNPPLKSHNLVAETQAPTPDSSPTGLTHGLLF